MKISGKSDLYTYFYLRSLHLLNPKGMHVFICSNSWLDVGYGAWMQYFLIKNVSMHFIIDNHAKRSFARSDVNTVITVFDAPAHKRSGTRNKVKFVALKQSFEDVILTENLLENEVAQTIATNERFRVYPISVQQLLEEGSKAESELDTGEYIGDKWGGKYLSAPDIFFTILKKGKGKLIKLEDVATVNEGKPTGANDFFFVAKDVARRFGIEQEFLLPGIMKTRGMAYLELSESSNWLAVLRIIRKSFFRRRNDKSCSD